MFSKMGEKKFVTLLSTLRKSQLRAEETSHLRTRRSGKRIRVSTRGLMSNIGKPAEPANTGILPPFSQFAHFPRQRGSGRNSRALTGVGFRRSKLNQWSRRSTGGFSRAAPAGPARLVRVVRQNSKQPSGNDQGRKSDKKSGDQSLPFHIITSEFQSDMSETHRSRRVPSCSRTRTRATASCLFHGGSRSKLTRTGHTMQRIP